MQTCIQGTGLLSTAPMGGTGTSEGTEKPQEPVKQAGLKSVTLSRTLYTYNGKATVTVKFKGGYGGTVKKTFTIRPAGISIRKLTASSGGFAVKWKKKTVQERS